jgi:hypothetical protein
MCGIQRDKALKEKFLSKQGQHLFPNIARAGLDLMHRMSLEISRWTPVFTLFPIIVDVGVDFQFDSYFGGATKCCASMLGGYKWTELRKWRRNES